MNNKEYWSKTKYLFALMGLLLVYAGLVFFFPLGDEIISISAIVVISMVSIAFAVWCHQVKLFSKEGIESESRKY